MKISLMRIAICWKWQSNKCEKKSEAIVGMTLPNHKTHEHGERAKICLPGAETTGAVNL